MLELEFNKLAMASLSRKLLFFVLFVLLLFFIAYWVDLRNVLENLSSQNNRQVKLKQEFETKQERVSHLMQQVSQLQELEDKYQFLVRKLPLQNQISELLEQISKLGDSNGLEFKSFKPLPMINRNSILQIIPIQFAVIGNYHQLANFVSQIFNLDMIVTVHDFQVVPVVTSPANLLEKETNEKLELDVIAQTYHLMKS